MFPSVLNIVKIYQKCWIAVDDRDGLCAESRTLSVLIFKLRMRQSSALYQRIAGITSMLQQSLEGLLIEGLQTSNVDMVRHCLRTYATIDKTRDAEALVGQVLVKPYMDQVNTPCILLCSTIQWMFLMAEIDIGWTNQYLLFSPSFRWLLRRRWNPVRMVSRWCTQDCWSLFLITLGCLEMWLEGLYPGSALKIMKALLRWWLPLKCFCCVVFPC